MVERSEKAQLGMRLFYPYHDGGGWLPHDCGEIARCPAVCEKRAKIPPQRRGEEVDEKAGASDNEKDNNACVGTKILFLARRVPAGALRVH